MAQPDNELYNSPDDIWWQPNSALFLLKAAVNPPRVAYFRRVLLGDLQIHPAGKRALDVGCGGGILCEDIARMGFDTTGVDPSEPSLRTARGHAEASGLRICYELGSGERLAFPDGSFDVLFCCDVLEHVADVAGVIAEFSRVLKPDGVFCYDTINRTLASWLVAIKICQEWRRYACLPPNLHAWKMFIKPGELIALLRVHGFDPKGQRGIAPAARALTLLSHLRRRARGELTFAELGAKLQLRESNDMRVSYMGYAIRAQLDCRAWHAYRTRWTRR